MTFSTLALCVVFILSVFSVGESLLSKLHMGKLFFLIVIVAEIIGTFIPPISLGNFSFTISGFLIPALLSLYFIFRVGSMYGFLRIGICTLLVTTLMVLYNVVNWETIEYMFLQPYLIIAIVVGIACFLISKKTSNCFISIFLGSVLSEIIYFASQDYYYYFLGGEKVLATLVVGMFFASLTLYMQRKVRYMKKRKARRNELRQKEEA